MRDAHSVERWTTDDLRRRAVAGLPLGASEIVALLDSIEGLQRAMSIPPEFVVRVARDARDVERWSASHPLLRFAPTASHPADALALASSELRRVLADRDWPAEATGARRNVGRIDRPLADAHANGDSDVAASLRWALSELDRVIAEALDRQSHAMLRVQSGSDPTARADLGARNASMLQAAGVTPSTSNWDTNGFGEADDVDLLLPCLVLAFNVAGPDDVKGLRFHAARTWHALQHCLTPRPMRTYRTAIVTPVARNPAAELALRRIASRCPTPNCVPGPTTPRWSPTSW